MMHDWTSVASVVLLGAYVVLTGLIARFTKRSAEASEKSAKASEESARAAQESARIAQESARHGDRAYVAFQGFKVPVPPNSNQAPRLTVELKNVGRTPALDGKIASKIVFWQDELKERHFDDLKRETQLFTLGPQTSHVIDLQGNLLADQQINALNSGAHLWVYGLVIYTDIFGETHETWWCLDYSAKTQTFGVAPNLHKMT